MPEDEHEDTISIISSKFQTGYPCGDPRVLVTIVVLPTLLVLMSALPLRVSGTVVHGFGRGSKELGIPTANMDSRVVEQAATLATGVYYGWASVDGGPVYKAVTSVGWNPQFMNEKKSVEVHILHEFQDDFYDKQLKFIFMGYIRDECKFDSLQALIDRIHADIAEGSQCLDKSQSFISDTFFTVS